jgi:prevent-host-death family protein
MLTKEMRVNIQRAKADLSRLLARVELGEEIIISRAGTPVARLTPMERKSGARRLGSAAGEFRTPDDFNARCRRKSRRHSGAKNSRVIASA